MKNNKLKFLILIPVLALFAVGEEYTIEDILSKVKDCSDDIALAEIEYAMGQEDVVMARSEALPQINFSTGLGYTGQSSASQAYMNEVQFYFDSLSYAANPTGNPPVRNPLNELTHIHGTTINWSATLSQPLITFGRVFSALKIAKTSDTFYTTIRDIKKEAFYLNVFLHFKNAYEAQENLKSIQRSLAHAQKYYDVVKTKFELGNATKRDTLLAVANLFQVKAMIIKSEAAHKASVKNIAQLTEITMPVESTTFKHNDIGWFTKIAPNEEKLIDNLEIRLKENEVNMRSHQITYERGKLLPSIYFNAGLNNNYMIPNFKRAQKDLEEIDPNATNGVDIADLMDNFDIPELSDYGNIDYFNYSLGLQLTWNIFDGRRSISNYKKIKLQHEKSERELKIMRDTTKVDVEELFEMFETINKSIEALGVQQAALNNAFETISEDLNDGFADYLTFLDMEKSLSEVDSQLASLQMQKNLIVAQYRIKTGKSLVKDIK